MDINYKFHLSPEWEIEITPEALKRRQCYPYGPVVDSSLTRIRLLEAALDSEIERRKPEEGDLLEAIQEMRAIKSDWDNDPDPLKTLREMRED